MTQKQPDILAVIRAAAIEVTTTILKKTSIEKRQVSFSCMEKADIQNLEDGVAYDIHQIYLVSEKAARILIEESDEIVFYNQELNAYVWCITFCGADWSEVLTSIPLNPERTV